MSKKQIVILCIVGVCVTLIFTIGAFLVTKNSNTKEENKVSTKLKVGQYELEYGIYIGEESEYNSDTGKVEKKEIKLELNNDNSYTINGTKTTFTIIKDKLYVDGNEMIEVTDNNKLTLLAGSGVEFNYKE